MTLFSIVNDSAKKVHLILDEKLQKSDLVAFHPMLNTATTAISSADMNKIIELSGH